MPTRTPHSLTERDIVVPLQHRWISNLGGTNFPAHNGAHIPRCSHEAMGIGRHQPYQKITASRLHSPANSLARSQRRLRDSAFQPPITGSYRPSPTGPLGYHSSVTGVPTVAVQRCKDAHMAQRNTADQETPGVSPTVSLLCVTRLCHQLMTPIMSPNVTHNKTPHMPRHMTPPMSCPSTSLMYYPMTPHKSAPMSPPMP